MTHTKDEALRMALDWYDSGHEDREEFQAMIENLLAAPVPLTEPQRKAIYDAVQGLDVMKAILMTEAAYGIKET